MKKKRCEGQFDSRGAFSLHSCLLVEVSMAVIMLSRALAAYRDTDSCVSSTLVDEDLWTSDDVVPDAEDVFMRFVEIACRAARPLGGRPTAALSACGVG